MRLILHQAMKDLRAQRWLVAAWAATLLAAGMIAALKLDVVIANADAAKKYSVPPGVLLIVLAVGRVVLGWLLAVRIVHADPVGDASAFWLTRPLSPAMLMASKLGLLAILFFVVPGLEAAVVFLANDVAPAAVPAGVLQLWLFDAVLLIPFVLLATLTRDLARIGLATVVGTVAWAALVGVATLVSSMGQGAAEAWVPTYRSLWLTWGYFSVAIVVLSAGLVVWQYQARRTAVTAWATLVCIGALAAAAALPSARFRPTVVRGEKLVDTDWAGASGVTVSVAPASIHRYPPVAAPSAPYADQTVRLLGDVAITGSGDAEVIDVADGRGTLRVPDRGKTLQDIDVNWFGFSELTRLAFRTESGRRAVERAIGARLVDPRYPSSWWNALFMGWLPRDDYQGYQGLHASYEADLVLAAYHIEVSAAVPARPGSATGLGTMGVTLLAEGSRRLQTRCWQAAIRETDVRRLFPPTTARLGYVLRNPKLGEAVPVLLHSTYANAGQGLGVPFLMVSESSVVINCGNGDTPPVDAAWLADAELLMVAVERLGTFRKHVVVPDFTMPEASRRQP